MTNDERRCSVLAEMRELDEQWKRVGLHLLEHRRQERPIFTLLGISRPLSSMPDLPRHSCLDD
jgi:hypothetical protein